MEPQINFGDATITNAEGTRAATPGNLDLSVFNNQQEANVTNRLQSIATAQTPIQEQESEFEINVDGDITSDLLTETTPQEVFDARAGAEAQAASAQATLGANTAAQATLDQGDSLFRDPTSEIISILNADPTTAETEYQTLLSNLAEEARGIDESLTSARERGERDTGLFDLQKELNTTNTKIANRQAALRRRLRDFDKSAEARGVARQFVQDERSKIESDATAELADLAIIQNAQQGNVQAAQNYINTAVENKYRTIETELSARQFELQAAESRLEGEEKDENLRLQLALSERQSQIADKKEQEKSIREFAITAAQNGAPSNLVEQIMQTGDVNAGLAIASPYIGRYDRMKVQADLASKALSRRKTLVELALAGDQSAISELGTYGQYLQGIQGNAEKKQREIQYNQAEERIDLAKRIKQNELGLNLNTGAVKNALTPAVTSGLAITGAGTLALPGVGTVAGGIAGLSTGLYVYSQGTKAKEDFLADMKSLVAPGALQELVDQKAQGATFGALSNAELGLLLAASQELAGHVNINDRTGDVTLIGSPEAIQADLDRVIGYYEKAQIGTNKEELGADGSEVDNLF